MYYPFANTQTDGISSRAIGIGYGISSGNGKSFGFCPESSCKLTGCIPRKWSRNAHGCEAGTVLCGNEILCGGGWKYRCCVGFSTLKLSRRRRLKNLKIMMEKLKKMARAGNLRRKFHRLKRYFYSTSNSNSSAEFHNIT